MKDLASAPLPLNENGIEYWKNNFVDPYFDLGSVKKRSKMLAHTSITTIIAIGLCIQFIKRIRQKNMDIHRIVGRITLVIILITYPHFAYLLSGFSHQPSKYIESPILIMIPFFAIRGWLQIRNKQVMEHRASMIMLASCFYFFGVARLVLMLMKVVHSGPWAKYTGLGDWKLWSYADVHDAFGIGMAFTFLITFGIGVNRAYFVPGAPPLFGKTTEASKVA